MKKKRKREIFFIKLVLGFISGIVIGTIISEIIITIIEL